MGEYQEIPNEHQLWVNLSSLDEGNLFSQLPQLISKMFEINVTDENDEPVDEFNFTLASDYTWRIKIYLQMLEEIKQLEPGMLAPWNDAEEVVKLHHWNIVPKEKVKCTQSEISKHLKKDSFPSGPNPITWTIRDIAKAASLLTIPPIGTDFDDEQEMRRVYTLIYDTFRYKGILIQALNDIAFYQTYPNIQDSNPCVWLLFFDLYHRSFKKRESAVVKLAAKLFEECRITVIEVTLWQQRVKLAAAVARLRIKHSALRLSELLPKHLRDQRLNAQGQQSPVTCWINPNKIKNEEDLRLKLEKQFHLEFLDKSNELTPNSYRRDILCPNFFTFHSSLRTSLAQSSLIQKHQLVVQDRSFCLGPATFGKIIFDLELTGSVIQSHVNSPRTTAYLATLLSQNSKISNLLVFSAGPRKCEYESYFQQLGMKNISIYAEKLIEIPSNSDCLDPVIAVFATPPNSYSAVADPIDLVCSRGGDLSMLQVLTESELTEEGRQRVASILDEQRKTLRYAMSKPQIQLVLYETHSELDMENDGMVHKTMKDINKLAKIKHASLQGKLKITPSIEAVFSKEINNNLDVKECTSEESVPMSLSNVETLLAKPSIESIDSYETFYKDVVVPNCDLFDKPKLPNLCPNEDGCLRLSEEGCYLALLQRKEVTKLNNKYMIGMAETRGLFGGSSSSSSRNKARRGSKSKKRTASPQYPKIKKKTKNVIEIDKIAAPTQASIRLSTTGSSNPEKLIRCAKSRTDENESLAKAMKLLKHVSTGITEVTKHWEDYQHRESIESKIIRDPPPRIISTPKTPLENMPSLEVLKILTNSSNDLKDLISSRVPYKSTRRESYGYQYYVNNNTQQLRSLETTLEEYIHSQEK